MAQGGILSWNPWLRKAMEILFEYLFRMIQERLGQELDIPAASITEDVVDHRAGNNLLTTP